MEKMRLVNYMIKKKRKLREMDKIIIIIFFLIFVKIKNWKILYSVVINYIHRRKK